MAMRRGGACVEIVTVGMKRRVEPLARRDESRSKVDMRDLAQSACTPRVRAPRAMGSAHARRSFRTSCFRAS